MAVKTWSLTTPADDILKNAMPGSNRDIKEHIQISAGFYAEEQSTPDDTIAIYAGTFYVGSDRVEYAGLDIVDLGTGGAFEVSAMTTDYYNKILFSLDSYGTLVVIEGTAHAVLASVTEPILHRGQFPVCMVSVQDDGTGTAGTILSIEQSEIEQIQRVCLVSDYSGYSPYYGATDQGVTGINNTLKYYIDQIGSDNATIVLRHNSGSATTTYTLTTSETIPSNITLTINNGAIIDGAGTLTINGSIEAGNYQILGSSLSTDLSSFNGKAKSEWFDTLELAQESDAPHLTIESDYSISAVVDFDQNNTVVEFIQGGSVTTTDDTVHGLTLSGDNCKIISPKITGPGTFVQDDSSDAALIYISGDLCQVSGGELEDPPTAGIYVDDGDNALINGVKVIGGVAAKTDTFHFGVKIEDSLGSTVNNCFIQDCIQGVKVSIQASTPSNTSIINNYITNCFDHAIYGGGERENFSYNQIISTRTGSGTAIVGQGNYGNYSNNKIYSEYQGGITIRNINHSIINNNNIEINSDTIATVGISLSRLTDGNITSNIVSGNAISYSGTTSGNGIQIISSGAASVSSYNTISDNKITNPCLSDGDSGIYIYSLGQGKSNTIMSNGVFNSGVDGITVIRSDDSIVNSNVLVDFTVRGIDIIDTSDSQFSFNSILDVADASTSNLIKEADSLSTCTGNTFNMNKLVAASKAASAVFVPASVDYKFISDTSGTSWVATGNMVVYPTQGNLHFVKLDASGRNFNAVATWPTDSIITVVNTSVAAYTIDFDSAGINSPIAQNERGVFGFDGTSWYKIYTGS